MRELYILCVADSLTPVKVKLKGGNPQVAFTNKILAEKYIEVRGLSKDIKVVNIKELKLEDNAGIIIEDKETALKLLSDPANFDPRKYYKALE